MRVAICTATMVTPTDEYLMECRNGAACARTGATCAKTGGLCEDWGGMCENWRYVRVLGWHIQGLGQNMWWLGILCDDWLYSIRTGVILCENWSYVHHASMTICPTNKCCLGYEGYSSYHCQQTMVFTIYQGYKSFRAYALMQVATAESLLLVMRVLILIFLGLKRY